MTNLLPTPHRLETVKEPDILEQVGEQPKTRWHCKDSDAEENQAENRHGKEKTQQAHHAHTQVPDTLAHHGRPQREEHDGKNTSHDSGSHRLLLPLGTFVQPDIVHHGVNLLMLLDLHGPLALDTVLGLGVVVSLVRVDLADTEGEQGEREQLEDVLGGGAVGHGWEDGVLFSSGFGVGGGLDGPDGSLDCDTIMLDKGRSSRLT